MAGVFDILCTAARQANGILQSTSILATVHVDAEDDGNLWNQPPCASKARQHMLQWQRHRGVEAAAALTACMLAQGNTILAMDYMENGTLWDQLPRTNKAGQRIFQWKLRGKKVAYEIALGLHCLHDLK